MTIKSPIPPNPNPKNLNNLNSPNSHSLLCKHSPFAFLDLLLLTLVLFSSTFLLFSYLSYLFTSLSLLLSFSSSLFLLLLFLLLLLSFLFLLLPRSRKCHRPNCKGLKKALEFDLQILTEDSINSGSVSVREIDRLPWKGGSESNPDYECLRAQLRKMAPLNGRAVLLFRARCGCPVAKLQGWAPKKGRHRHKKALTNVAANGRDLH